MPVLLPSNADALQAAQVLNGDSAVDEPIENRLNTMCATIWEHNNRPIWYIGYCTG